MERRLKELVGISSGVYSKTHSRGEVFYLLARDFQSNYQLKNDLVPEVSMNEKYKKHFLDYGDILFASKGHHFFAAVYKEEVAPAIASSVFLVLRPKRDDIFSDYLAWYLNHSVTQKIISGKATGSSLPSIGKKDLNEIIISIPPMEVQQKIVEFQELRKKEEELRNRLVHLQEELINYQLLNVVK